MRLGMPIAAPKDCDPLEHMRLVREAGCGAMFCPMPADHGEAAARTWQDAAGQTGVVLAEVGAWSNPIDADPAKRAAALEKCKTALDWADRVGARCCVNIAGSRNPQKWDGPHRDNLTAETEEMIVASVREIIDAVKPKRSKYTLETMPWIAPHGPENYAALIRAIDRRGFGVHLDVVNLVNCPQRYFDSTALIEACLRELGPHIRSVHAKDILCQTKLTLHLDEVAPGQGVIDYPTMLRGLEKLDADMPVMLEHLPSREAYEAAAAHLRSVAAETGVTLRV